MVNFIPMSFNKQNSKSNSICFKGWTPNQSVKTKQLKPFVAAMVDPQSEKIAISGHTRPDGDCIGAGFALANLIHQTTGKKIDFFIFGDLPNKFKFLNKDSNVNIVNIYEKKDYKAEKLQEKFGQYDLAIAVDTALKRLIPDNYFDGIFSKAKATMKIDHHPYMETFDKDLNCNVGNNFADYNYLDDTADSASQIIMQLVNLFKIKPKELHPKISEAIYTGIVTDTDNFRYARSHNTFADAALLIKNGVNNIEMQTKLRGDIPPCIHKLKQYLYNNIQFSSDKRIAYFVETPELAKLKEEAKKEGYKDEALEEVMDLLSYMLQIKDVEISMKIAGTNFSVRSKNADTRNIAMKYGGGGHFNASAFCIKKDGRSTDEIIDSIIKEYQEQLEIRETFLNSEK